MGDYTATQERLMKQLCFLQTVVASIMESDTISHLEKQQNLLQSEMDISFMQNIWAKEVHFTNPFTEANTIIQELMGR